jgi:hypothetical protein
MDELCCPPLEESKWDSKTFDWDKKKFAKDSVFCLFYMPVSLGKTMKRLMGKLEQAKATSPDYLCLADHTSKWNMDVYLAVDNDLPDTQMQTLSGRFLTRVYEGPFKDTGKWCADFAEYSKQQGVQADKLYLWYTTCPKCAKKRGKNHVVIFGQVKASDAAASS